MVQDLVFVIDGMDARLSTPVSLRDVGPPTADSYSAWIAQHPQMLGATARIVATDLRWQGDGGADDVAIDVLGMSADGRLAVGVVVVDDDPSRVLMRALTQAAYASRITPRTLVEMHARYLRTNGQPSDEDSAVQSLTADIHEPLRPEALARPRIVVFSERMSPAIATTAVWLNEMGVDITLQGLRAHEIGGQLLLIVSRVYPPAQTTELDVARPRRLRAVASPGGHEMDVPGDYDPDLGDLPPAETEPPQHGTDPDVAYTNGFGHGQ